MKRPRPIQYVPGDYRPGCVISVPVVTEVGEISHKGILSDKRGVDGLPMVIHNAKLAGHVVEDTMTFFYTKAIGPIRSEGYPSALMPHVVLARARTQIGKPWRVWDNCEHFAGWAHDLPKKSPELRRKAKQGGLAITGFLTACFFLASRGTTPL
jgi:hypothetical protein